MKRTLIIYPTTYEGTAPIKSMGEPKVKTGKTYKFSINAAERNICLMVSGMRCPNVIKLVEETAKEFAPERVILCGYCGACDPNLQNGEFMYSSDDEEIAKLLQTLSYCPTAKIKCSDHLVEKDEKLQLNASGYTGVEMESDVFIDAIRKHNPRATFTHIRCVSDSVDCPIPASFFSNTFDANDGTLSMRKIFFEILKHPSLISALKKFANDSKPTQKVYEMRATEILNLILNR